MIREYINNSIMELEALVVEFNDNIDLLASIKHELGYRKTKRAKALLSKLQKINNNNNESWISEPDVKIVLPNIWVKGFHLDKELKNHKNLYTQKCKVIEIVIQEDTRIILEAGIRILCLANQLSDMGKEVRLVFDNSDTVAYLNIMDFFKLLSKDVNVFPYRPTKQYKGKGGSLVELAEISADIDIAHIPAELNETFRNKAKINEGSTLDTASYTVFGEMIRNVQKHSKTKLTGYVALQCYEKAREPYIQIVVSDSGKGITNTIRPTLHLYKSKKLDYSILSDGELIKVMFEKGGLSRFGPQKGGTGLNISWTHAMRTHTRLVIRQDCTLVRLSCKYVNSKQVIESRVEDDLPMIKGTHITFDFFLD